MADQPAKLDQSSEQTAKQDTKEEISTRVTELKEKVYKHLEGDDTDPMIVERMNQIFNDALAAIPPDPQEPKFQRATIATTMKKLREQAEGSVNASGAKKEAAEGLTQHFKEAEDKAKEEDKQKKVTQPAGPSQSPQQANQPGQPDQMKEPVGADKVAEPGQQQQPPQQEQPQQSQPPQPQPQPQQPQPQQSQPQQEQPWSTPAQQPPQPQT